MPNDATQYTDSMDAVVLQRLLCLAAREDPGPHPHVKLEQTSIILQGWLRRCVAETLKHRVRHGGLLSDEALYLLVLEQFGIDCPHTITHPLPDRLGGVECAACRALFFIQTSK